MSNVEYTLLHYRNQEFAKRRFLGTPQAPAGGLRPLHPLFGDIQDSGRRLSLLLPFLANYTIFYECSAISRATASELAVAILKSGGRPESSSSARTRAPRPALGTMQCLKPSLAASRTRKARRFTARNSPERPTSPIRTLSGLMR